LFFEVASKLVLCGHTTTSGSLSHLAPSRAHRSVRLGQVPRILSSDRILDAAHWWQGGVRHSSPVWGCEHEHRHCERNEQGQPSGNHAPSDPEFFLDRRRYQVALNAGQK